MNEYSFLVAIAVALLGGAMSPGPSFLIVAQNSLSRSRADGFATAIGTGLGAAFFACLAALGVTTLLEQSPKFYWLFRAIGGVYLLWLAYRIWRAATQPLDALEASKSVSTNLLASGIKGFIIQTSNPKTIFIIASIFSAVMPDNPPANTAVFVTLIAFVIDFSWYAIVAASLSQAGSRAFYAAGKTVFDRVAAVLLLALSFKLFFELF
ncbi:MAG: LysE family translocator [Acidiferrobacterales bacterium]|nr:LysE family translocator [Acidiferrobacterales bacterium]